MSSQASADNPYRGFEDLYRKKWTWDRVARGTHGTNCAGTCAFNVYVVAAVFMICVGKTTRGSGLE